MAFVGIGNYLQSRVLFSCRMPQKHSYRVMLSVESLCCQSPVLCIPRHRQSLRVRHSFCVPILASSKFSHSEVDLREKVAAVEKDTLQQFPCKWNRKTPRWTPRRVTRWRESLSDGCLTIVQMKWRWLRNCAYVKAGSEVTNSALNLTAYPR